MSTFGVLDVGRRARAQLLELATRDLRSPQSILDVGCGQGLNAMLLAQWFPAATVVGVDLDERVIEIARNCARSSGINNVSFEVMSSGRIDGMRTAELVVCIDVLEHLAEDANFAADLLAHVAPNGVLIAHVPLRDQHYFFSSVRTAILANISTGRDPHVREGYSREEIERLMSAREFNDLRTETTLGGVASLVADLESLGALRGSRWLRVVAISLLPVAGCRGGSWSKGLLLVGSNQSVSSGSSQPAE